MTEQDYMMRAIELAQASINKGENGFGSVIVSPSGEIIAESENQARSIDVTCHAEIMAMREAQKLLKSNNFFGYTLYATCEPCPMCSFMIRELKFSKVVFGTISPIMGGYSKWAILQDPGLKSLYPYFSDPPEIITGFMSDKTDPLLDPTQVNPNV